MQSTYGRIFTCFKVGVVGSIPCSPKNQQQKINRQLVEPSFGPRDNKLSSTGLAQEKKKKKKRYTFVSKTTVTSGWRSRGVLTAFYKNSERQGKRCKNSMDAVARRWEIHRTPWKILERQGSEFLLDMLKTNAITRRSNKSAMGTP